MPQDSFTLNDFFFDLPEDLIAQYPADKREESRLFILNRKTNKYEHDLFRNLDRHLLPGDVLVLNNTRVIPARLYFIRESGGLVEFVLTHKIDDYRWLAICNRTKRLKKEEALVSAIDNSLHISITGRRGDYIEIQTNRKLDIDLLEKVGEIPLPPYINRKATELDKERYQTVYARQGSAAASPTAGLHFSEELIDRLTQRKINMVYLTLDVSWGTFQQVRDNDLSLHEMHSENYSLPEETADAVNIARDQGRRVIAVGTTSLRVLESTLKGNKNIPGSGETNLFIYPPMKIKSIDAMITNFHTPYSTLLMLVCAFAGYERIMDAYKTAVKERYRFFSYGDAMLIL